MLKDLSSSEIGFLAVAMKKYAENKVLYNKALTTKNPKEAWKQYKPIIWKDTKTSRHIKVVLAPEKEGIFTRALKEKITSSVTPNDYDTLTTIVDNIVRDNKYKNDSDVNDYRVVQRKLFREDTFKFYKQFFTLFESYGSKLEAISQAIISNGTLEKEVIICSFSHKNEYLYEIRFPLIDKDFIIRNTNSLYIFNLQPKNLTNYLQGLDKELEFFHPYEYLCRKALEYKYDVETRESILIAPEYFEIAIERDVPNVKGFQKRIDLALRSAKENYNDDVEDTPIIWLDKCKSKTSIEMNKKTVFINLDCDTIHKYRRVKGIDLFTGSTSTPAIRCRIASNFDIVKEGLKIVLRKVRDYGPEFDYVCDFKKYNIGMFKTSSKRDNCSTIKDSFSLTKPVGYVKRVTIK